MSSLKQSVFGILTALLLGAIVLGSLTLSMAENTVALSDIPDQEFALRQSVLPTLGPFLVNQMPTLSLQAAPETAGVFAAVGDFNAAPPTCSGPPGWTLYIVMPDDTLASLALRFGVSLEEFSRNNCLQVEINRLPPGTTVFVPNAIPLANLAAYLPIEATPSPEIPSERFVDEKSGCGPPAWWFAYTVRWGDTLSGLAVNTGATVAELRQANCIGGKSGLRAGQVFFLPVIPAMPVASPQAVRPVPIEISPTALPTHYPTLPVTPPDPTGEPLPTEEPTVEPTEEPTVEPTDEPTVEPTKEPTVEPTGEPTVEPTEEPTQEPTEEPTMEPTEDPTQDPVPSKSPTLEPAPTEQPAEAPIPSLEPGGDQTPTQGAPETWIYPWLVSEYLGVKLPGRWYYPFPNLVLEFHYWIRQADL